MKVKVNQKKLPKVRRQKWFALRLLTGKTKRFRTQNERYIYTMRNDFKMSLC